MRVMYSLCRADAIICAATPMTQSISLDQERREIADYSCPGNAPLDFSINERTWLETHDLFHLRRVWGYRCETEQTNYEDETHGPGAGLRALQEYTDPLFRTLSQMEDQGLNSMMPTDFYNKLANQSDRPLETRLSPEARHNIAALLQHYFAQPGVSEAMALLAGHSLANASLAFACFVYSARQLQRMVGLVESFPIVDEIADLWYAKVKDLSE